ncbi:NRDE protein-domain-containing protein [Cyathus striatus]|nr:NRDE protein-domain-containing protein [Cyathus striatus]
MCIGIWTLDHPEYALILCTNRDEYLDRPTLDAHWHNFEPVTDSPAHSGQEHATSTKEGKILSGRDIKAGGSWFGINTTGRIALLTNITEPPTKLSSSRGFLDELGRIVDPNGNFAGFNLTLFAPNWSHTQSQSPDPYLTYAAALVTNHGASGTLTSRPLNHSEQACGAISNGIDGQGGEDWQNAESGEEEELLAKLFSVLSHRTAPITHRTQLRTTVQNGPDGRKERYYGTRLSTVLLVRHNGEVLFVERDIWKVDETGVVKAQGPSAERRVKFRIPVIPEEREGR